jgi:tetraacyldisaccharide 4'-kinase
MFRRWYQRLRQYGDKVASFVIDIIYERRKGRLESVVGFFLRIFSTLFAGLVQIRWWLYRIRILHDQPLGCLVVVVGNLTVGGTGKTPVVEKFARTLHERGRKVAILSRGYGSKSESFWRKWWRRISHAGDLPPRIVSDGRQVLMNSEDAGDEPYMLARNLPGVVVLVDRNRVKSGRYAIQKFGADTLILDDGFQYLPLKGRLNLLLIDKNNPFGNNHLLPRGILREPIKHLSRASYIFLTKSDGIPDPALDALIQEHNPHAEVIECSHRPQYLQNAFDPEDRLPLDHLKGRRIAAFSGIAVPESFENFLMQLGAQILYVKRFLDHHRFSAEELSGIFHHASEADAEYVVTTEKDAVRIEQLPDRHIPLYYLRLEIELLSGRDDFEAAVARICFPKGEIGQSRVVSDVAGNKRLKEG